MIRLFGRARSAAPRFATRNPRRRKAKPTRRSSSRSAVLTFECLEERLPLAADNSLTVSGPVVAESDASAEFSVTLIWPAEDTVSVHYETRDGTAFAGADYTSASGDLTFAPGEMEKTVSVAILDDFDPEYEEEFYLDLSNAVNASIDMGEAVATICENDPALNIDPIDNQVADLGTEFYYIVTANDPSDPDGTLTFSLAEGAPNGMTIGADTGDIAWTPTEENGPGQFGVTVSVTNTATPGRTASATFTITIEGSNTEPTTNGIADVYVDEDAADTLVDLFAAFDDQEDTDARMTYAVTNNDAPELFSSVSIDAQTGELRLDYAPNANGTALIAVEAVDTGGLSVETWFMVDIAPVDDAPVITDFVMIAQPNDRWKITGTVTDVDDDVDGWIVTFGGALASYGYTATVDANGFFSLMSTFAGLQDGTATAETSDGLLDAYSQFHVFV